MAIENTRKALENVARRSSTSPLGRSYDCASIGIEADPTLLLEAMVKDGMLRESRGGPCWYEVIQPEPPHVHEWKVIHSEPHSLTLECTVGESYHQLDVPNRLPIEMPED